MKTVHFLFFTTALFLTFRAEAQLEVGVQMSYGSSWQEYGDDFTPDQNNFKIKGFRGAISLFYPMNSWMSIGVEPAFTRRGAACVPGFVWVNPIPIEDASINGNYVELPLLAKFDYPIWKDQLFAVARVGASAAYMLNGFIEFQPFNPEDPTQRTDIDFEVTPEIRRWDFGLHTGLGLGYQLGGGMLSFDVRYYHGLKDVSSILTSRNRAITYGLGYSIPLNSLWE